MKRRIHAGKPSLNPQNIDRFNWYYEGKKYFIFVHEARSSGGLYVQTDQVWIPVSMLEESLCRISKKK